MYKTRKIGFGLTLAFGLLLTAPAMAADDPCQSALNHIAAAQATVTQLQQLGAEIRARHAQLEATAVASTDSDTPLKCPACGMMMPTKATATMTRAVKYGGKTYYCCKGCDMSATADKE
jgi:Pyruvate/2-oxoacid:ferredoxin oxidoreductase delta subunit